MSGLNIENFEEVKIKGEEFYKSTPPIFCPYLQKEIHFTAEGLEHLKFKARRKARPQQDQYMRFKLLDVIPEILGSSKTVQGILETQEFVKVRINNRTEPKLKPVIYYEFLAVIKNVRVKVIIKSIEGGTPFFWSIIPSWGVDKETHKRKLHSGKLGEEE